MRNLNSLKDHKLLHDVDNIELTQIDNFGEFYQIDTKGRLTFIFIPEVDLKENFEQTFLSYYAENELRYIDSIKRINQDKPLLKQEYQDKRLIEFNHEDKTFKYTELKDFHYIDAETKDLVRQIFILLNMSLKDINYFLK